MTAGAKLVPEAAPSLIQWSRQGTAVFQTLGNSCCVPDPDVCLIRQKQSLVLELLLAQSLQIGPEVVALGPWLSGADDNNQLIVYICWSNPRSGTCHVFNLRNYTNQPQRCSVLYMEHICGWFAILWLIVLS